MKTRIVALCVAVGLSISSAAFADTITLTDGSLTFAQDPAGARFIGPGLDLSATSHGPVFPRFFPVGTTVDFSGRYSLLGGEVFAGGGTVNGEQFSRINVLGSFDISAMPVLIANMFSTPFSLMGTITGEPTNAAGQTLFSVNVIGSGSLLGAANLVQFAEGPVFRVNAITFDLQAPQTTPSPTPEPATMVLLGIGLFGATGRKFLWATRE